MAAGAYTLIKQGDIYRILYTAKNFKTGLTIKGTPFNPSMAAQTQITFTEASLGVYYYDWDSTTQTLGTWTFKIDATTHRDSAPAAMRIQIVDPETLDDTIFESAITKLDSIISTQTSQGTSLGNIYTDTQAIKTDVQSGTYGLSALKTLIDTVQSAVTGIQNNTSTTVALPTEVIKPQTGSIIRKIKVNIYDAEGHMEDPDADTVTVTVKDSTGTDVTATFFPGLTTLTKDAVGVYSISATFSSSNSLDDYIFTFSYIENTLNRVIDRSLKIVDSNSDITSALTTINTKLDTVDGRLTDGTSGLAAIKTGIDSANSSLGTININVNSANNSLSDIKGTGFTAGLHDLVAIVEGMKGGVAL